MANLHVQPKRRNNSWIWILVIILIIAAGLYYYFNYYKKGITPGDKAFRDFPSFQIKPVAGTIEKSYTTTLY